MSVLDGKDDSTILRCMVKEGGTERRKGKEAATSTCGATHQGVYGMNSSSFDFSAIMGGLNAVLIAAAVLCGIFALVIWASNKLSEQAGSGMSESRMISFIQAAIGFAIAAGIVATVNITTGGLTFGG